MLGISVLQGVPITGNRLQRESWRINLPPLPLPAGRAVEAVNYLIHCSLVHQLKSGSFGEVLVDSLLPRCQEQ